MQIYIDRLTVCILQPMELLQLCIDLLSSMCKDCKPARRLLEPDISLSWQGAGSYSLALSSTKGKPQWLPGIWRSMSIM